nr:hypothetical protein [Lactobacillus crispatus]
MENTVGFEKLSSNELVSVVGGSKGWNKFWKSEVSIGVDLRKDYVICE